VSSRLHWEDEWDVPEEKAAPARKPYENRETRVARQAATKRSNSAKAGAQVRRRQNWEASPAGKDRLRDVVDYATEQHNRIAKERPELGLKTQDRLKITPRQAYEHYGFSEQFRGPRMEERQIPGLEDPHALPTPRRWEEHTPEEQAHIQKRVKQKTGATLDSMTRAHGSQLDQAHTRAREMGHDAPYSQDFYHDTSAPGRRLRETAERTGAPLGLVAATNADTSPQMAFSYKNKKTGDVSFPNADQAEHAIRHVQQTGSPEGISKEGLTGLARTGFSGNLRKAAHRAHQVLNWGASVRDTYSGSISGFGPKTAAYHNSWLTGTPDFTTSDVHTGGGGALPHLSSEKPQKMDKEGTPLLWESGAPMRTKSEREKGIETKPTAGFHAMSDYAMRQAMSQRGLGRVRQAQASQWGEERIHRHETEKNQQDKGKFPSQEESYGSRPYPQTKTGLNSGQFGQGRMF
jgi:hypothetical protein